MINNKDLIQKAKSDLKGNWFRSIVIIFIPILIAVLYSGFFNLMILRNFSNDSLGFLALNNFFIFIITFIILFMGFGSAKNFILQAKGIGEDRSAISLLFEGYKGKNIINQLVIYILTTYIPGIIIGIVLSTILITLGIVLINNLVLYTTLTVLIAIIVVVITVFVLLPFSYSVYVLANDITTSPIEALVHSKRIFKGHIKKYFFLVFRFIPYFLLVIITFGLASFYVYPLYNQSISNFYLDLEENYK